MAKLIVGLGNPGTKYANTRHNIGWMVLDAFVRKYSVALDRSGHHGVYGESKWPETGEKLVFLKPMTFMNLSGQSVAAAAHFYKVPSSDVFVMADDLDLPPGKLRLREKGGSGGHNGLKSISQVLGAQDFPRMKIGIGRPAPGWEVSDWVLAPFGPDDLALIAHVVPRAVEAVESFLREGIVKAMTRYNG